MNPLAVALFYGMLLSIGLGVGIVMVMPRHRPVVRWVGLGLLVLMILAAVILLLALPGSWQVTDTVSPYRG